MVMDRKKTVPEHPPVNGDAGQSCCTRQRAASRRHAPRVRTATEWGCRSMDLDRSRSLRGWVAFGIMLAGGGACGQPMGGSRRTEVDDRVERELLQWVNEVAASSSSTGARAGLLPPVIERRQDGGRMILVRPDAEERVRGGDSSGASTPACVTPFYCDETEVTVGQFARFVAATGHKTSIERGRPGMVLDASAGRRTQASTWTWRDQLEGDAWSTEALPVVLVDWEDATAFASWVSCSLPSEREFDCAVNWGRTGGMFPWGNARRVPSGAGNFGDGAFREMLPRGTDAGVFGFDDGVARRARVRSFAQDPLGTFDLIGNVWEWTRDRWLDDVGQSEGRTSAVVNVAVRGGGWDSELAEVTCCARGYAPADQASDAVGFRCVSRPQPQPTRPP